MIFFSFDRHVRSLSRLLLYQQDRETAPHFCFIADRKYQKGHQGKFRLFVLTLAAERFSTVLLH